VIQLERGVEKKDDFCLDRAERVTVVYGAKAKRRWLEIQFDTLALLTGWSPSAPGWVLFQGLEQETRERQPERRTPIVPSEMLLP